MLGVRMSAGRVHDVKVSYAVPTPTWKAAYRVVLDDDATKRSLIHGWALVNNASQEDWHDVQLTLATGAPMSFVHDLHTPQYVKRPDINGNLIAPTALGLVDNEKVGAVDIDRDGILDVEDACPDTTEDRDQYEDEDGCPETDNDSDRISDRDDKCPHEPETYNGLEDDDGCPDRGRVVVSSSSIEILDQVYFAKAHAEVAPASLPIVDAIAATLRGNSELVKIEIGGHASDDETEAWSLSSRRAAAVRQALVPRGVDAKRLVIVPYGATRPLDHAATEAARAKNRRVDFLIAQRHEPTHATPRSWLAPTKLDPRTALATAARNSVGEPRASERCRAGSLGVRGA